MADSLGVSTTKLKRLKSIKNYEPQLLEDIDMGKISVGKAYQIVREKYIVDQKDESPSDKFENEFQILVKKYKPSIDQIDELVKNYKLTLGSNDPKVG